MLRVFCGGNQRCPRGGTAARLRLTTTNAFAARWLVPKIAAMAKGAHSRLKLEIVSTDEVLSLKNGEADISIRYVRSTPTDGPSFSADARQIPRRCRSQTGWKIAKAPESCRARRISPAESTTSMFRIFLALSA